jgi:NAD(P)-dependent dehydrogenase (short-subunit alcohol dehydrogenase family)
VNDRGTELDGSGSSLGPAQAVVQEIQALGGEAVANGDDVADWAGAGRIIDAAVDAFGALDVVVANAGIYQVESILTMTPELWDRITRVHMLGTMASLHWAGRYWRDRAAAGIQNDARIITTSSIAGLSPRATPAYAMAKAGIAALTRVAARELGPYGVTVNSIAPHAQTRMATVVSGPMSRRAEAPPSTGFDEADPANNSPLVVWLGSEESRGVTGRVFRIRGGSITLMRGWSSGPTVSKPSQWDPASLGFEIDLLVSDGAV